MTTSSAATGSASDRGRRRHRADALAVSRGPAGLGVAVADGIGDTAVAADAARAAADAAAVVAAGAGAVDAVLAARKALQGADGDAVLVVAAVRSGRCEVAWVGDCRAYLWDGATVRLLTVDHTAAQAVRDAGGRPPRGWEHVVLQTAGTAQAAEIGHVQVPAAVGRLALVTDGVHREVHLARIVALLRDAPDCAAAARGLTDAAVRGGGRDNASATVVEVVTRPVELPRDHGNLRLGDLPTPRMPVSA